MPTVNTVGRRKSLSGVCKAHICSSQYLDRVLSKCVLPNSLIRCMSVTNRADDNSPTKTHFDICVFGPAQASKHKAKGVSSVWPEQCEVRALSKLGLSES